MSKQWIPAAAVGTLLGVAAWKEHKTIQGAMGDGERDKINYRRKHKARSYRHRDTVRAKLLQDEANTKRRREDRKSASEGRQARSSHVVLRSSFGAGRDGTKIFLTYDSATGQYVVRSRFQDFYRSHTGLKPNSAKARAALKRAEDRFEATLLFTPGGTDWQDHGKTGLRAPSNAPVKKPFSYGSTSEREVLEALHLQALETCDQTYADYAPPEVLRGLERKGYITQNRGTPGNWTLTSKGLKWADKTRGLDGKRGRRAKHSKRDFVKQVWERQAPTMTGGPLPPPIPGMEGPFRFRSGKILYWDPKEGKYYDRGRDLYVEDEDVEVAMSGRRAKSHNRRVSKCISGKVRGEGWDQRQAVAACLNMDREGRLRADGSYKRK
jgi:hypothetical protein